MRIEEVVKAPHTAPMTDEVADALYERAAALAYNAFGQDTSDDHIDTVYERVVVNWLWGAGVDGAVTVH